MQFLLGFLYFFILVAFVFYLPGRFLLRIAGNKAESFTETLSLSIVIGLSLFIFFTYLLSWIKIEWVYNIFVIVIFILEYKKSYYEFRKLIKSPVYSLREIFLILFGSAAMVYLTWNSGSYRNGDLLFYGVNSGDSLFHLSLIGSLINNFPPIHPELAGIPLKGYNFFYDFLLANFAKFYHFDLYDLFFRYFSLFISLIYGLSSLALSKFLKWGKRTTFLFILLIYFVQSFDFFAYYLYRFFNSYYNSSGILQSLVNILDPSVIFSYSFMLMGLILLLRKGSRASIFIASLVIGLIPEIKIYSGIIFYFGLFFISFLGLLKKDFYYLFILFLSGIISAILYIPINFGAGGLTFAPLLIYKNYIDSAWLFNNWHWNVNYPIFAESHNYIHLAYFYLISISIFLLTSLGIRILIILDFKKIFSRKFYNNQNIFLLSSILFSFIIPSLFIQSVSAFSIIQFFWIGYLLLLIPTAFVIGKRMEKMSTKTFLVSIILLIILFFPETFRLLVAYSNNPAVIDSALVKQALIMKNIPAGEGILVVDLLKGKNKYMDVYSSPVFSAISAHAVYYEHVNAFAGIDNIIDMRKADIEKIDENMVNCNNPITAEENIINVMKNSNNMYLLILDKNQCTEKFNKLKIVNEEKNSVLYKI